MKLPESRKHYHRGTLKQYKALMLSCRDQVSHRFFILLRCMLDDANEAIFSRMESVATNAHASRLEETQRAIRLQRTEIEQLFYEGLLESFKRFDRGVMTEELAFTGLLDKSNLGLTLVDQDSHELEMSVTNIVSNVCFELSVCLAELDQRLAAVAGGMSLGERSLSFPAGPRLVCRLFLEAISLLDLPQESQLMLLDLFDIRVMQKAREVYESFNQILTTGGVLPHLRPGRETSAVTTKPTGNDARASNHSVPSESAIPALAQQSEQVNESLKQQLFDAITEILSGRYSELSRTQGAVKNQINHDAHNLVDDISANMGSITDFMLGAEEDMVKQARNMVRQENEKVAALIRGSQATDMKGLVDLVGMLFDYILNDPTLPDTIKAVLSCLHTPYLKVAMHDRQLFTQRQHPARQLLNALSQAGMGYSPSEPASVPVLARIQSVVLRVVRDFKDDFTLFQTLLDEFESFMRETQRRASIVEKRAIEAQQGKTRLRDARKKVYHSLMQSIAKRPVPDELNEMLMGPWLGYLLITFLRSGEESASWHSALELTGELIASVQNNLKDTEKKALLVKLPSLVDQVRAGLEMTGDTSLDIDGTMKQLQACHQLTLSTLPVTPAAGKQPAAVDERRGGYRATNQRMDTLRQIVPREWQESLEKETDDTTILSSLDRSEDKMIMDKVRLLPLGTWFEFTSSNGRHEHGKLAWVNAASNSFLFVNHGGRQIAVKSLHQLVDEIKTGLAEVLEPEKTPLMDRAMKSIHSMLKRQ